MDSNTQTAIPAVSGQIISIHSRSQRISEMHAKASAARAAHDYPRAIAWQEAIAAAIEGPRDREWKAYSIADGLELAARGNSLVKRYVSSAERVAISRPGK